VFGPTNGAADFAGVAVRTVKQQTDFHSTLVKYKDMEPADFLTRGAIMVEITSGTPTAGSPVFIRIADNPAFPGSAAGDFVASDDGVNTVELDNAVFHSGKVDSNGVAEITVLTRKA
jgi:hypothetical protein